MHKPKLYFGAEPMAINPAVNSLTLAYDQMQPSDQEVFYNGIKHRGGGEHGFNKDRLMVVGVGAAGGLVLGYLLCKMVK